MKNLSTLNLRIGNEVLYYDVDEFMNQVTYLPVDEKPVVGDSDIKNTDIMLPKFEFFKLMIDTTCNIIEDVDPTLGSLSLEKMSVSYKLALNTLIQYKIIKKK
tara:strand:- start:2901 stop:3209 length:309 start_codon:yes stop_codon:yes gene_type:complete